MSSPSAVESTRAEMPDFSDVPDVLDVASRPLAFPSELRGRARFALAPTRAELRRRRWIALGLVALWALAQFAALGLRFDFDKLPFGYVALTMLLPLVLGIFGLGAALHPGRSGLGASKGLLLGLVVLGPLSVIASTLLLHEPYTAGIAGDRASVFLCGNVALAWAAMPLLAASLALRSSFVAGATLRGALVGGACGLGAAVAAQVRCPVTGALHILLAHAGVVLISTLLGAFLLGRATRV
jgi:hypothetical protein